MKTPCKTHKCPYGVGPNSKTGLCEKCYRIDYKRKQKTRAIVQYIGIDPANGEDQTVEVYYHYTKGIVDYYEVAGIRYNVVDPSPLPRTISEKDLECLQRYYDDPVCGGMDEDSDGEYVRWDSLIQLLK